MEIVDVFLGKISLPKKLSVLATTYSRTRRASTTIGAGGLNFRVRNENGCTPAAVATKTESF